jgi:hypothetical protein
LNQTTELPDAILVSAGGDDLVGDQLAIYLDYKGSGLNTARFQGVLDSVRSSYMDLFARFQTMYIRSARLRHGSGLQSVLRDTFRDIFAKGVPIIGHCYD